MITDDNVFTQVKLLSILELLDSSYERETETLISETQTLIWQDVLQVIWEQSAGRWRALGHW